MQALAHFFGGTVVAWIVIRLSVTLVGSIIEVFMGQELPLGSAWVNWLCLGLAMMATAAYLIREWYERENAERRAAFRAQRGLPPD